MSYLLLSLVGLLAFAVGVWLLSRETRRPEPEPLPPPVEACEEPPPPPSPPPEPPKEPEPPPRSLWERVTDPSGVTRVYRVGLCDEMGNIISTRIVKDLAPTIYRYHGRGAQTAYTYRYTQSDGMYIYQVRGYGS